MTPELRFPEFEGEWQEIHGRDAFGQGLERGDPSLPIWSVTMDRGLVPRNTLDRQMEADATWDQNRRAVPGDLVYNTMRMWQGAVGEATEECMLSPAYVVLRPKEETAPSFFLRMFETSRTLHDLGRYSHGLTSDRLRLYYDDFADIPFAAPGLEEQRKIAVFLDAVGERKNLAERRRDGLVDYKRGLMQALFSRRLRFRRDDGTAFPEWEKMTFGSLVTWHSTNSLSRSALTDEPASGVQNIHYGDIHGRFPSRFHQSTAMAPFVSIGSLPRAIRDDEYLREGDIIIADASEDQTDIGKALEIAQVQPRSLVAGLHTFVARPKPDRLVYGFGGYLLASQAVRRQIMRASQGISVLGISKGEISKVVVRLPHPDEQRKIADVLSALDDRITAATARLDALKEWRRGLLQKMFVR